MASRGVLVQYKARKQHGAAFKLLEATRTSGQSYHSLLQKKNIHTIPSGKQPWEAFCKVCLKLSEEIENQACSKAQEGEASGSGAFRPGKQGN
jgi:hypothetical protein